MYSLLLIAGPDPHLRHVIERAQSIVRQQMPTLGSDVALVHEFLPAAGVGWFCFLPCPAPMRPLITAAKDDEHTFLVYGELFDGDRKALPANVVRPIWLREGAGAVCRLNGSFSAICIHRHTGRIEVASDQIGRRTLRHAQTGTTWLLSTHDLPLVATGLVEPVVDLVSAASIVACDWSLGGRSLLQPVRVCDPAETLVWDGRELTESQEPRLSFARPGNGAESPSSASLVGLLCDGTRALVEGAEPIQVELTGGLDSRAILAAALSVVEPDRITAVTRGTESDGDVHTARLIANRHGIRHCVEEITAPAASTFLENCRTLAYFMNGDTNGKRALAGKFTYDPLSHMCLGGTGGEIFRGYYSPLDARKASTLSKKDAPAVIQAKMKRLSLLPWSDPRLADDVRCRVEAVVSALEGAAETGSDVLDLFYLYERFGRWALGARLPNEETRYFPFENVELIRRAWQLPSPVAAHCDLHNSLIRKYLPRAWWLPVNGNFRLPLANTRCGRWLQRGVNGATKLRCSLSQPSRRKHDIEHGRAAQLSGECLEACRGLLVDQSVIGDALFGVKTIRQMLDEQVEGRGNHLQVIGFLLTLETWHAQVAEAHRMSTADQAIQLVGRGQQ